MAKCCCCSDKSKLKKGVWTVEEDQKLIAYVKRYGHWNWRQLPKYAGLSRCGKSCRMRWKNYLNPNIRRGGFSREEEEMIIEMYAKMGGRWSTMASLMPGRTDNDIKNHWITVLKRRVMNQKIEKKNISTTMANQPPPSPPSQDKISPIHEDFSGEILSSNSHFSNSSSLIIEPTTLESAPIETVETPTAGNIDMWPVDDRLPASFAGDFWTEPLWMDSNFDLPFDYQYQVFGDYLLQDSFDCGFGDLF